MEFSSIIKRKIQKKFSSQLDTINKLVAEFKTENERPIKLNILKNTKDEFEKFEDSSESSEMVEETFKVAIDEMKKYFTDNYNNILQENTFSDINSVDKSTLDNSKKQLENLVLTIKEETDIVLDKYEAYDKTAEIDKLISSYAEKLDASKNIAKSKTTNLADSEFINDTHYENEYFNVTVPKDWSGRWKITKRDEKEKGKKIIAYYYATIESTTPGFGGVQEILVINPNDVKSLKMTDLEFVGRTANGLGVYLTAGAGAGFFSKEGAQIAAK